MTDSKKTQYQKFKEAARDLETDDSEENFDATLKRIGESRPRNREDKSEVEPRGKR